MCGVVWYRTFRVKETTAKLVHFESDSFLPVAVVTMQFLLYQDERGKVQLRKHRRL